MAAQFYFLLLNGDTMLIIMASVQFSICIHSTDCYHGEHVCACSNTKLVDLRCHAKSQGVEPGLVSGGDVCAICASVFVYKMGAILAPHPPGKM